MSGKEREVKYRDEIELTAADWRPHAQDIRDAVDEAVQRCHEEHGKVCIGLMRPFMPKWATGPQVGSRMTVLVRAGTLVWDGRSYAPNGNRRTRNSARPSKVYTLAGGIRG